MNEPHNISAQDWFDKADADLFGAVLLAAHLPDMKDLVTYHCQQCAEKYLKGLLFAENSTFPKTHSLLALLDILTDFVPVSDEMYDKAGLLQRYAVDVRYPQARYKPELVDAQKAIDYALDFKNWALDQIQST